MGHQPNGKIQAGSIGDYSTSPTGQGCLWATALGIMGVIGFSYLSTYAGFPHDTLDRVDRGIAAVSRPTSESRAKVLHAHRRQRRKVVYQNDE